MLLYTCVLTGLLVGPCAGLPVERGVLPLVGNRSLAIDKVNENAVDEHFANIVVEEFIGVPDMDTGDRVRALTPDSGVNPETLGNYFEGDILLPKTLARNGLTQTSRRWPENTVPYVISGSFSSAELSLIDLAMRYFHTYTCIRFVERTNQDDYIDIKNTQTGCWSMAGRGGGRQELNLQTPGCVWKVGTPIHELNHAVGFMHEQSRPERDSYVTIKWENIQDGRSSQFQLDNALSGLGVSYDYASTMHYSAGAFSKNYQPTIVPTRPLNGIQLGQRDSFSWGDVYKINRMYQCAGYQTGLE